MFVVDIALDSTLLRELVLFDSVAILAMINDAGIVIRKADRTSKLAWLWPS
jgi:hypothetical protein